MKTAIILFNQTLSNGEFYFNACLWEVLKDDYTIIHPTTWDEYRNVNLRHLIGIMASVTDMVFLFVDHGVSDVMLRFVSENYNKPGGTEFRIEIVLKYFGMNLTAILNDVSERTKIPVELIKSRTRKQEVTEARQFYCKRARELTKCSLDVIGREINRDHSTVLYSIKTVNEINEVKKKYERLFEARILKRKEPVKITIENKALLIGKDPVRLPSPETKYKAEYSYIFPMSGYRPHSR